MSNSWPPAGTPPSGLPSYCDIRNPDASKASCMTGGGSSTANMMCSIINPNTSKTQCDASLQTSQAAQSWAAGHLGILIPLLIVGMLIFFGGVYMFMSLSTPSYGGGRIGGFKSILKGMKRIF